MISDLRALLTCLAFVSSACSPLDANRDGSRLKLRQPMLINPKTTTGELTSKRITTITTDIVNLPVAFDTRPLNNPCKSSASGLLRNDFKTDLALGMAEKRLPQAIIIGVKKCGTRAVLEFLKAHPDIRAAGPEVHFFDKYYNRGTEWYKNQMPATMAGQLTIEKTPSYFVTHDVATRMYNMSRDIRLIIVVRDPVSRAVSDFAQAIAKRPNQLGKFESRAFIGNWSEGGVVDSSWGAISIGLYARHLRPWLDWFPREQLHFVHGEQLVSDPTGQMAALQEFLGLRRIITSISMQRRAFRV